MSDEWSEWFIHDGRPRLDLIGVHMQARLANGRATEGVVGPSDPTHYSLLDWAGLPPYFYHLRVVTFRIRRPKAVLDLIEAIKLEPVKRKTADTVLWALGLACIFLAAYAVPTNAATERSLSGTIVQLQPADPARCPKADAQIMFDNKAVNGPADDSTFPLELGDVVAGVTFTWNVNRGGDDEITVETDEAHVPVPRRLTTPEGQVGFVCIHSQTGLGM